MVRFHRDAMGTQIGANPFQVLQRVLDDRSVLLQDCNEPPSLTLCQLIADDDWHGSVVVKKGVLQSRRQRLQLEKRRLRFLLSIKLTLAIRICLLGEMSGIFIKGRLSLSFLDGAHYLF